eukprot:gene13474-9282_t
MPCRWTFRFCKYAASIDQPQRFYSSSRHSFPYEERYLNASREDPGWFVDSQHLDKTSTQKITSISVIPFLYVCMYVVVVVLPAPSLPLPLFLPISLLLLVVLRERDKTRKVTSVSERERERGGGVPDGPPCGANLQQLFTTPLAE